MSEIRVELGPRSYPIVVQAGLLGVAATRIAEHCSPTRVLVLTHPKLDSLYGAFLTKGFEKAGIPASTMLVPSGERFKTLKTVSRVYRALLEHRADRLSALVVLGGGVLGDVGGFAAATFLRGISFIQIPTTLLSQVDAAIGGKTGVDLPQGKNLVGAFHQPRAVLIDTDTLRSLPARELRSGMAEVIKYGIICDKGLFDRLGKEMPRLLRRDSPALASVIVRSCEIKADIVSKDESELGLRAILNFGHTVGHALESVTEYRQFKHGEAISVGMVSAALVGEELGTTSSGVTARIVELLTAAGLPTAFPGNVSAESVVGAMSRDKKAVAGRLTFVLAPRIGETIVNRDVPSSVVRAVISRQSGVTQ
jgi:3-dehydroquinate synthase